MLVKNQKFKIKWTRKNNEWYIDKGYIFSNFGDYFEVNAEDLMPGSNQRVNVECDYCKKIVTPIWKDYLKCSKDGIYACAEHRQLKASDKYRGERIHQQYIRAEEFCNNHNYILITPESELETCHSKVEYKCPKHGVKTTNLLALTQNHGCSECMHEYISENLRASTNTIINIVKQYNGIILNPEDYTAWNDKNMIMICPECGEKFVTSINSFVKHDGQRCPQCTNNESKGEMKVRLFLEEHNIGYIPQYRFDGCKYKATLPFDFYLPDLNIAIEYDGEQHFMPIKRGKMTDDDAINALEEVKIRDNIKTNYCNNNGIILIRIPYYNYDNINDILYNKLFNN